MLTFPITHNENGGFTINDEVSQEQQARIDNRTSQHVNATHIIYYEGDEPGELMASYSPEIVPEESKGTALQAFMDASLEEKILIAQQLKQLINNLP